MKYGIPSAGIAGHLLDRAVVRIIPLYVGESPADDKGFLEAFGAIIQTRVMAPGFSGRQISGWPQ